MSKLYDLKRGDQFIIDGQVFTFDHVDGMYSVCYDSYGSIAHIAAYSDVDKVYEENTNG